MRKFLFLVLFYFFSQSQEAYAVSFYDSILAPLIAKCPEFISGDAQIEVEVTYSIWETGIHFYQAKCAVPIVKNGKVVRLVREENYADKIAGGDNKGEDEGNNKPCERGSILLPAARTVGEIIPVVGAPFDLYYFSSWSLGSKSQYQMDFSLNDTNTNVTGYKLQATYAGGRVLNETFSNVANQTYTFNWDGKDNSNIVVAGAIAFNVNKIILAHGKEIPIHYRTRLGKMKSARFGFGQWLPSVMHAYDTVAKKLYRGTGEEDIVDFKVLAGGNLMVASQDVSEIFIFDSSGKHLYTKYPLTGENKFEFEYASGKLVGIHQPNGQSTIFSYSGDKISQITAPYGQITTLAYDSNDYLSTVTDPKNNSYRISYGPDGLMSSFEKPGGQRNSFKYDSNGRLTLDYHSSGFFQKLFDGENSEDGHFKTTVLQTKMGRETVYSVKNALETVREKEYSVQTPNTGYRVRSQETSYSKFVYETSQPYYIESHAFAPDPRFPDIGKYTSLSQFKIGGLPSAGHYTKWAVSLTDVNDPFSIDTLTKTEKINGKITTSVYDGATKTFTSSSAAGRISYKKIDDFERPIELKSGSYAPLNMIYDSAGKLSQLIQADRTTQFSYNQQGYVSKIVNAIGIETRFETDSNGNVIKQIYPDKREINYSYDKNINLVSVTPPGKTKHSFLLNTFEAIKEYLPPSLGGGPIATKYSYNPDKQVTKIVRPDGQEINYSYHGDQATLEYIHTPLGDYNYQFSTIHGGPTLTMSPDGVETLIEYQGPLQSLVIQNGSFPGFTEIGRISWQYDSELRVKSVSVRDGFQNFSNVGINYDQDNFVIRKGGMDYVRNETGGISEIKLDNTKVRYSYDPQFGELSKIELFASGDKIDGQEYKRDKLGRIKIEESNGQRKTVHYDSSGRFIGKAPYGDKFFSEYNRYDSNGNRVLSRNGNSQVSAIYDAQDRLMSWGNYTFTYNENGDLETKTNVSTSAVTSYQYDVFGNLKQVTLPNADVITYGVDGNNRRVFRKLNGVVQKHYLYENQLKIAAEVDSSFNLEKRFVYERDSNVPDYMVFDNARYIFFKDARGSVIRVVNSETGETVQTLRYDSWGKVLSDSNPGFQPFGFAGGLYDSASALVRFGARDYDAETGRWLTKDPIGFEGRDTNLYGYVSGDPINFIDANGLVPNTPGRHAGAQTAGAFSAEYIRMLLENRKNSDKYHHCVANCIATKQNGSEGSAWAEGISNLREKLDQQRGDSPEMCAADQEANEYGRDSGEDGKNCSQACKSKFPY